MQEGQPQYLTLQQVSDRFQVSVRTLRYWRTKGVGPKAILLEGSLRYPVNELDCWLRKQQELSES